jgi:hypothetical protein
MNFEKVSSAESKNQRDKIRDKIQAKKQEAMQKKFTEKFDLTKGDLKEMVQEDLDMGQVINLSPETAKKIAREVEESPIVENEDEQFEKRAAFLMNEKGITIDAAREIARKERAKDAKTGKIYRGDMPLGEKKGIVGSIEELRDMKE